MKIQKKLFRKWFYAGLILLVSLSFIGCGSDEKTIIITGHHKAVTNGATLLYAFFGDEDYGYNWAANGGSFDRETGSRVIWKAPSEPGDYIITVSSGSISRTYTVKVVESPLPATDWSLEEPGPDNYGKVAHIKFRNDSGKTIKAFRICIVLWDSSGERITNLYSDDIFHGRSSEINIPPNAFFTDDFNVSWG